MPRDRPTQSTWEGDCPGVGGGLPRTPVSAFSPPAEAWSLGSGMSPSSTIVLRVEPKKGGARDPIPGPPGAQAGSPRPQPQTRAGGGALFTPPAGQPCWTELGCAAGPAEWVGLAAAFSGLGLFWKVPGGREGRATWYVYPLPPLCFKFHPPVLWGNAAFFSFSFSLLHVFTDHSIC